MSRLGVICARGGSKGIPSKNLRVLGGIPLIAHTIMRAQESVMFDSIAVSSDSGEILEVASAYGIQHLVRRPPELSSDSAAKIPAIRHCLLEVESGGRKFEYVADLDCTVPYRLVDDIRIPLEAIETTGASSLISVTTARKNPYFNIVERDYSGKVRVSKLSNPPYVRRQDAPECFDMNASIYIWHRSLLLSSDERIHADTLLYEMPFERSIDIDSELDFALNEFLMKRAGLI